MDLSYQLYSSRNFPPLEATLAGIAEIGYAQVEGYGGLYEDLTGLGAALSNSGLTMASGHFGFDMLEQQPGRVLEIAGKTGMRCIYCPFIEEQQRPASAAGWRQFGARLDELGGRYRSAGLIFGWHNHGFEFAVQKDGSVPMDELLAGGPDLSWQADIAWIVRSGANPLDWISRHGSRMTAVHVKDIAIEGECRNEDGWADVGRGTMDWPGLMAAIKATPADLYVLEHDNPSDDMRFAKRSHACVQAME